MLLTAAIFAVFSAPASAAWDTVPSGFTEEIYYPNNDFSSVQDQYNTQDYYNGYSDPGTQWSFLIGAEGAESSASFVDVIVNGVIVAQETGNSPYLEYTLDIWGANSKSVVLFESGYSDVAMSVSVSQTPAVPESPIWAMMLLGVPLIGWEVKKLQLI